MIKLEKVRDHIKALLPTIADEDVKNRRETQLKDIEKQIRIVKKDVDNSKVSLDKCSSRIKQFAAKYGLKSNDKEGCSLILMMDMLAPNGTAIGVLKEGVFFNKTYKDIRKCLIENFNVREVISVPQDQFENTSTKTSIVIFDNTEEKTSEIRFSDLMINTVLEDQFEEENGRIVLKANKGDIIDVEDALVSQATITELLENSICSLNGKDYNKREIICGEEYKLIRLGDIVKDINKSYQLEDNRKYNYVEIGDIVNNNLMGSISYDSSELPNRANIKTKQNNILISCVRPKPSKILLINSNIDDIDNYVFSSGLANIELNEPAISPYVFGILYIISANFEKELCNGSSYPRFSPKKILNIQIPIPKNKSKIKEWVDKISAPYNEKNEKIFIQQIKELSEEALPHYN